MQVRRVQDGLTCLFVRPDHRLLVAESFGSSVRERAKWNDELTGAVFRFYKASLVLVSGYRARGEDAATCFRLYAARPLLPGREISIGTYGISSEIAQALAKNETKPPITVPESCGFVPLYDDERFIAMPFLEDRPQDVCRGWIMSEQVLTERYRRAYARVEWKSELVCRDIIRLDGVLDDQSTPC